MQVTVGAEFGGQGADLITTRLLGRPDGLPMLLMEGQLTGTLRRGGVRDLRALVITDTGLNVMDALDERAEVVLGIVEQALTGDDPVADVAGETQIRQLTDQFQGHPWVAKQAGAVGFEG